MRTQAYKTEYRTRERGYTLLFAVLTAALVLGVAVFILDISRKQYELSVSARDSMYSFYAADSGIECAATAYRGTKGNIATSTDAGGTTIYCGSLSGGNSPKTIGNFTYTDNLSLLPPGLQTLFSAQKHHVYYTPPDSLDFALSGGTCTDIAIYDGYDSKGNHWTVISSDGYNHCSSSNGPDTTDPTTVDRELQLLFQG